MGRQYIGHALHVGNNYNNYYIEGYGTARRQPEAAGDDCLFPECRQGAKEPQGGDGTPVNGH